MDETRGVRFVHRPNKPGSGRQTTRRPFPLTVRFIDALVSGQRCKYGQLGGTAGAVDGHMPLATSSAAGLVLPEPIANLGAGQSKALQGIATARVPILPDTGPKECSDVGKGPETRWRVQATAVRRPGSGRQVTPRKFVLSVALPQLRRLIPSTQVKPQPSPGKAPGTQQPQHPPTAQLMELELYPDGTATDCQPNDTQPLAPAVPSLEELVALAHEQAVARQQLTCSGLEAPDLAAPSSQQASVNLVEVEAAGDPLPAAMAGQPSTIAPLQLNLCMGEQTPAPHGIAAFSSLAGSPLLHSPGHVPTPVEGVPERFPWSAARRNAAAAARQSGTPERCRRSWEACTSSKTSMTPVEGVPERLTKRLCIPLRPHAQWQPVHAHSTHHGVDQVAARSICAPRGMGEADANDTASGGCAADDRGLDPAEAPYGMPTYPAQENLSAAAVAAAAAAAARAALERLQALATAEAAAAPFHGAVSVGLTQATSAKDLVAEEPAEAKCTAHDAELETLTAADVAAAVSAAARVARRRLQALASDTPSGGPNVIAAARSASDATPSNNCEASAASNDGTPAVIKIQNLAVALEHAVQRATMAIGGPPGCRAAQNFPCSGLPPRPPSAAGRAAPDAAAGAVSAWEDASGRRSVGASGGQPNSASIIHRAPPDILFFPSHTPSPMGVFGWPIPLNEPEPQSATGRVGSADMVTPMAGVTLAAFAGGCAATVSSTTPRMAVHRPAAAAAPKLVATATSPFTAGDLYAAVSAPAAAGFPVSPSATDARSDSDEPEQSAGGSPEPTAHESPAESSGRSPQQSSDGSPEQRHGETPERSRNESTEQPDSPGAELSSESAEQSPRGEGSVQSRSENIEQGEGEDTERSDDKQAALSDDEQAEQSGGEEAEQSGASSPKQSRSQSMGQYSGDGAAQSASNSADKSSGNCPEHSSGELSFGAQDADGPTASTPVNELRQAGAVGSDAPSRLYGAELDQTRILASVLRQDYEPQDEDDEELAVAEVMALPDPPEEPIAPERDAGGNVERNKESTGAHSSGRPALAQQRSDAATAAPAAAAVPAAAVAPANPGSQAARERPESQRERQKMGGRKSMTVPGLGLAVDEMGTRRSTRTRVRPLEYWRGERKSYGRNHNTMPTVTSIKMRTPEPQWPLPSGKVEKAKRRARTKQMAAED